jgi:two-component system chemotaxis response regulator CheB
LTQILQQRKQKRIQSYVPSGVKRPIPASLHAVCIGVSTGGPAALMKVLPHLPKALPVPVFIAQHMPPHFTFSLAQRLNSVSQMEIKEGQHDEKIFPGVIYIAPGGKQMKVLHRLRINIGDIPENELYKPSVNVLMNSVVDSYREKTLGIMMTGMGNDGQTAFGKLHDAGGYIISQDIESCVVPGMTKAIIDNNLANEIIPLDSLADVISAIFGLESV